jgi:hypothetical protein
MKPIKLRLKIGSHEFLLTGLCYTNMRHLQCTERSVLINYTNKKFWEELVIFTLNYSIYTVRLKEMIS